MGERGPGAYKIWLNHCSSEYADMIDGPASRTNEKIKEVRRHWRDGGRELIMRGWDMPGARPFAFWYADVAASDRRRAERICGTEAEMLLFLNLADEKERQAIAAGNIIEKQRRQDRRS
jgi:hypothetical protein